MNELLKNRRGFLKLMAGGVVALNAAESTRYHPIYLGHEVSVGQLLSIVGREERRGARAITVQRLVVAMIYDEDLGPAYSITLDDMLYSGYVPGLEMAKREVPVTYYVQQPDWRDGVHRYMTREQVKDLWDAGHEIGWHTGNHSNIVNLRARDKNAYNAEIADYSKWTDYLGEGLKTFAYPAGVGATNRVIQADLAGAGFIGAVSTINYANQSFGRRFELGRTKFS